MKRLLICLAAIAMMMVLGAPETASADQIRSYCKRTSHGNKYKLKKCIAEEKKAKRELEKSYAGQHIREYCEKVAGPSYSTMGKCVRDLQRPTVRKNKRREGPVIMPGVQRKVLRKDGVVVSAE